MIKPTRGRIFAEFIPEEEVHTASGIVGVTTLPGKKDHHERVRVLAVGPPDVDKKGKEIRPAAQVDDIVHYKKSFGIPYGKYHLFLKNDEIIAVERGVI